jgi:hypothetical protein
MWDRIETSGVEVGGVGEFDIRGVLTDPMSGGHSESDRCWKSAISDGCVRSVPMGGGTPMTAHRVAGRTVARFDPDLGAERCVESCLVMRCWVLLCAFPVRPYRVCVLPGGGAEEGGSLPGAAEVAH